MKFLITGDLYAKKGLFWGVFFFVLFLVFFWISSFFQFYLKYGFSYDSLFIYYFTDREYPEIISLQQLSEDFHINTFLLSFFFLMVSSIFSLTELKNKIKIISVLIFGFATIFYCLSDFLVFTTADFVIYSKLASFILLHAVSGYMLFTVLIFLLRKKTYGKRINLQILNIYLSSFLLFLFLLSCVFIFYAKYGVGIQGIKEYFLGNPQEFRRPKTFTGIFKSFYPHIITMALYSFTLLHFSLFKQSNKKFLVFIGVSLFVALFFENFSSVLVLTFGEMFVYLKLSMFLVFVSISFIFFIVIFFIEKIVWIAYHIFKS